MGSRQFAGALGWHDSHCASAVLVSPFGEILYGAAEERFVGRKMYKGYPARVIEDIHRRFEGQDWEVAYTDLGLEEKIRRNAALAWNTWHKGLNSAKSAARLAGTALSRLAGGQFSGMVAAAPAAPQAGPVAPEAEPAAGTIGYDSLCEHHAAHAASAYYLSGFDEACVVTIDGVGDCLSATISEGRNGILIRTRSFYYNELTVGADYETVTAMLGFNPDRHCGKITGLAAYGRHNDACIAALRSFLKQSWRAGRRNYFDRLHGPRAPATIDELRRVRETHFGRFSREDLAYAIQSIAEQRVLDLIRENVPDVQGRDIALAGGVFANVRINQKVKELGFRNIFIQPAMDDGGLSVGAALHHVSHRNGGLAPQPLPDVFLGPGFSDDEIAEALDRRGLRAERSECLPGRIARLITEGKVVARFDGRMEFGPRALGNRSILYDTRDPSVNQWLNQRLRRTEFMPFAPATLADHADRCYRGLDGCRHAAEFMTITFDCTDEMKRMSPAVVHLDGTARAQLVTRQANPGFYEIIDEYRKLTGIPSVVNTSFNMHESPIVCTPEDAIRSFQEGRLDYLAIGPFLVARDAARRSRRLAATHASLALQPVLAPG